MPNMWVHSVSQEELLPRKQNETAVSSKIAGQQIRLAVDKYMI